MSQQKRFGELQWLQRFDKLMEKPMIFLGFIWLVLFIVEVIKGLSRTGEILNAAIWGLFIFDFTVKLILAENKWLFLRREWLLVIALFVPALRLFRIFRVTRALRVVQGTRLVQVVALVNRDMRGLRKTMRRRGFAYVIILTLIVTFATAAGMYQFEKNAFSNYWQALWWTAMLLLTIGSQYWPKTTSGQILSLFISLYGFAVLGYITATLASFFVGVDAEDKDGAVAGADDIAELKKEIQRLADLIEKDRATTVK